MAAHQIVTVEVAPGRHVGYIPVFFERQEADELLDALLRVDMTPEVNRMFGTDHVTKRRTAQYGLHYDYNSTAKRPALWSPLMTRLRERVGIVAGRLDSALVQVYPDGTAGIGWHRDKGQPEIIASFSLGAEREFAFGFGTARACKETYRMGLSHGSLLLIPSETNEALKHRLPVVKRVKAPRVNVTLRRFPSHGCR